MSARIDMEMSIDEAAFTRLLGTLCRGARLQCDPAGGESRTWLLDVPCGGCVRITFQPRPARQLGALHLPRAQVTLDLSALPAVRRQAFVSRFRRHFQRGGG